MAPQPTALKTPSTARTAGRSGGCGGACDASRLSCFLFHPRKSRKKRSKRSHTNVSSTLSTRSSTPPAQTPHVCFYRRKWVHHPALLKGSHTRAHTPKQGPSRPRPQHCLELPAKFFYSATLLYTYISRFSVNPQHQQMRKIRRNCRHKFYPPTVPYCVSQLLSQTAHVRFHKRKRVHTLGFRRRIAYSGTHGETGGAFWVGVVSLPSI